MEEHRKHGEERERERHADAEEHRQRFFAPEAGAHQAEPQIAHLFRGARRLLAQAPEHPDHRLETRLLLGCVLTAERELLQTAVDGARAGRHQGVRQGRDHRGSEHEREERNHLGHGYTSIFTTCLIQK
jgi:hypothetical protein